MTNAEKLAALSAAGLEIVPLVLGTNCWDETAEWGVWKSVNGEWVSRSPYCREYHKRKKDAVADLHRQWEQVALVRLQAKAKVTQ